MQDNKHHELIETPTYKVLGLNITPKELSSKLVTLQNQDETRYQILVGICARLMFAEQIKSTPIKGGNLTDKQLFRNQSIRLSTYLTITCIDALLGEKFEHYDDWLQKNYTKMPETWEQAFTEFKRVSLIQQFTELFVSWTQKIYSETYLNFSMHKAFKSFVLNSNEWIKRWLLEKYVIEILDKNFDPIEPKWTALDSEEKSRRIAEHFYELRNRFTHGVSFHDPLDDIQESARRDGVVGFVATTIVGKKNRRRVALPMELPERDLIQFLIVVWLRNNWLQIADSEEFLLDYWANHGRSTKGEY